MTARPGAPLLLALLPLAACGGGAPRAGSAPPAPASSPSPAAVARIAAAAPAQAKQGNATAAKSPFAPPGLVPFVTPSRLLPDLVGMSGVLAREDGVSRVLIDRMRLLAYEDGALERAHELLPANGVNAVALPSRLGGGFLFHANIGGNTQMWRAPSWLAKVEPLTQLSAAAAEVVPGFDRLYVRLQNGNRLVAIDPQSGSLENLGPLPPAGSYGKLAFADGWRAVVDADLRGPLATFDAGATWRAVALPERAQDVSVQGGDPVISVSSGKYVLDARGLVTFRPEAPRPQVSAMVEALAAALPPGRPPGPLGKRPLRAALEDGFPDSPKSALVARGGALARVSLEDGKVMAIAASAYPEQLAGCHALRLGEGIGFVCGERAGPTSIYAFAAPLAMQRVMRFDGPRFVSASGNGTLVIRGGCGEAQTSLLGDARAYCVRDARGKTREIQVKGEPGLERVVALADGRVAVLVPPHGTSAGQLTLIRGSASTSVALRLPEATTSAGRELRQGMWLEGFEERAPAVLGGWVEAGGPMIGVRVAMDGKVTAGDGRDDAGGAVVSGRFGLSLGDGGRAAETTDGGMHWDVLDLPDRDDEAIRKTKGRACGPAGCALGGWLRVGWGKPGSEDDLRAAEPPTTTYIPAKMTPTVAFSCELGPSATPPLPTPPPPPPGRPAPPPRPGGRGAAPVATAARVTPWSSFRNTPPPALAIDEVGIDNGSYSDVVMVRAYAWGKKGADWARAGRLLVKFDDRFDGAGGVRQSAITASLWPDEITAADAVGTGAYGAAAWSAFLDPSGRAAIASTCRGPGCAFYAVSDGQPVLPIRDRAGRPGGLPRPLPGGAARIGEAWFFITPGSVPDAISLYRVDLGVARELAVYNRPARYGIELPRLVRRAQGTELGLLFTTSPEPGERVGVIHVLPVDPETGALSEPTPLVRRDFSGVHFSRCAKEDDGWLVDTTFEAPTAIDLVGGFASFEGVEVRARLDARGACIDEIAARVEGMMTSPRVSAGKPRVELASKPDAAREEEPIPLAATERATGRRWSLRCHVTPARVATPRPWRGR